MTRRKLDAAWWADAVRRYEAGEVSLLNGGREAGIDWRAFRRRLVEMGAEIRAPTGHDHRPPDDAMMGDIVRRYVEGEHGLTLERVAAEAGMSCRRARDEITRRGAAVRRRFRGSKDGEVVPRPPACRHCGFLVGSRCRCPEHAENRRRG